MKNNMCRYLLIFYSLFPFATVAQQPLPPDISKFKTSGEKLKAWVDYCDNILTIGDHPALIKAARKGLAMTPSQDYGYLSYFNFYIGISLDFAKQNDSVVFYLERSEKNARKFTSQRRIEETLMQLLVAYSEPGKVYKKALILAELVKRADTVKDIRRRSNLQSSLSAYYINIGEYERGMAFRLGQIRGQRTYLSKGNHDDSINFGVALVNIGELYLKMKNAEKAQEYLTSSLEFIKDYQIGIATIYRDLITTAFMNNNSDAALSNYKKLSDFVEAGTENDCWEVFIDANLAFAEFYLAKKKLSTAMRYVNRCRDLQDKHAGKMQRAQIDHMEGSAYLQQKNYPQALKFLTRAEAISVDDTPEAYSALQKSLSETYAAIGNWKQAYHHFSIYSKVQDELLNEKAKINLAKMEAQYQNKSKQREINALSSENTIKNLKIKDVERQRIFLISGISIVFLFGGLMYNQSRKRKKTNEKLRLLNAELDQANKIKARFFGILNHDLRSPVSRLISFLHLQKDDPHLPTPEKEEMELETIAAAENLLESMEDILLWSKRQMESFLPEYEEVEIADIFESLQKHFATVPKIRFVFDAPEDLVVTTDENYLKTILRNLIANAVKALSAAADPEVAVKAWRNDGQFHITVTDNGSGGTQEQFRALYDDSEVAGLKAGLGLHLIRDLAKAINCRIAVNTIQGTGTTFVLDFQAI